MRFKEKLLLEMAIKIFSFNVDARQIDIQIRTGNDEGGQGEHQPPHIHLVNFKAKIDLPFEISTGKPTKEEISSGTLSKKEIKKLYWFLEKFGQNELTEIFNKAQQGQDPEPLFNKLYKEKTRADSLADLSRKKDRNQY